MTCQGYAQPLTQCMLGKVPDYSAPYRKSSNGGITFHLRLSLSVWSVSFQETDPYRMSLLIYSTDDHSLQSWLALRWNPLQSRIPICYLFDLRQYNKYLWACKSLPRPESSKPELNLSCHHEIKSCICFFYSKWCTVTISHPCHIFWFRSICRNIHYLQNGACFQSPLQHYRPTSQSPSVIHCHWSGSHTGALSLLALRGCSTLTHLN